MGMEIGNDTVSYRIYNTMEHLMDRELKIVFHIFHEFKMSLAIQCYCCCRVSLRSQSQLFSKERK